MPAGSTNAPLSSRAKRITLRRSRRSDPGAHREIRISTGLGQGGFYRPRPEWLAPLFQWVERK